MGESEKVRMGFKFEHKHRRFLTLCDAQWLGYEESIGKFRERFGSELPEHPDFVSKIYQQIDYIRNHKRAQKWRDLRTELRRQWLVAYSDERLANKRPRLQELQKLYDEITEAVRGGRTLIKTVRISEDIWKEVYDQHYKTRLAILRQFQRETDPDLLGLFNIDLTQLDDHELKRVADGENPLSIISNSRSGNTGIEETET